ncbi:MAG TPA: glucose 1-dehydrogenase [Dehalococcoidia bacterium]|jgi:NAD(P)-dependent dehydrogenase (short-subunit alcohol dehydrogenase family)|nr:glucose 1-dehydrogenase [Dehalococcoidia bacterium]HIK88285.1 glucose 1-dehydrogenase [Dehalococcoidia bacterium]
MTERRSRLEGKVAIVTGAGSRGEGVGNGKATATLFAQEGAKVVLVDMEIDRAAETLAEIEAEGGTASAFAADVTSDDECRELVEFAIAQYGRLDILDNNVGNSHRERVTEIDLDDWDNIMTLNLKSMVLTSRHAIPRMIETGGGSIINISSISGVRAGKDPAYTASKAGVIGLTISMAGDHGREGIRVNAIAPGPVYTPMVAWRLSEEKRAYRKNTTMLRTEGTPWDVGWAAVFLASDESKWITGTVLTVDGGSSMVSRHVYSDDVMGV